jgi:hypothetical protein
MDRAESRHVPRLNRRARFSLLGQRAGTPLFRGPGSLSGCPHRENAKRCCSSRRSPRWASGCGAGAHFAPPTRTPTPRRPLPRRSPTSTRPSRPAAVAGGWRHPSRAGARERGARTPGAAGPVRGSPSDRAKRALQPPCRSVRSTSTLPHRRSWTGCPGSDRRSRHGSSRIVRRAARSGPSRRCSRSGGSDPCSRSVSAHMSRFPDRLVLP